MSREEAIEVLNGIEEVHGTLPEDGDKIDEALSMAIKALEQEPCGDSISRQAVHKEILVLWNSGGDKDYQRLHKALDIEKGVQDAIAEIQDRINHWEERKPNQVGETAYVECKQGGGVLRNPREIEFVRYDNRIDGLEEALAIIRKHTGVGDTVRN